MVGLAEIVRLFKIDRTPRRILLDSTYSSTAIACYIWAH